MKLNHVIVSTNENPLYYDFWDVIRPVLIEKINVIPILVLIGDEENIENYENYIIHKIKAVDNLDTGFQAQIARLFVPKFYLNEVCLTSDIDMLLINKEYFNNNLQNISDENFVVFGSDAYKNYNYSRYPICYTAATGKVFQEVLHTENLTFLEFCNLLKQRNQGWDTDELYLGECVDSFDFHRIHKIPRGWDSMWRANMRIDRVYWKYDENNVNQYIDSHMLRPYQKYKNEIDYLISKIV